MRWWKPIVISLAVWCIHARGFGDEGNQRGRIDFTREIRPILSNACFHCHGPDDKHRKADLRLDTREGAMAHRDSGALIVPGKPDESELLTRILSDEPELKMPPPKSGKVVTPEQVRILRRWIEQGGEWTDHWAFVPPVQAALPAVKHPDWVQKPMDQFVLARLEQEGLAPSPQADKVTLLRRLFLDLVGLPPTSEEVDAYLKDQSPDAYSRQVERLLKSPHYGEKWGRMWLDAARYADSDGYEKDKPRNVWFYRDWVVNAFNRDLPYDQFIIEQLAGDQLPNCTQDQRVATGFLRNSMVNEEGGIDPEQFRMEAMFDRMDTIGKSILGMTISCCQCHSHKYDPVTQEDYYRMFAFLNNDYEASMGAYTVQQQQAQSELLGRIHALHEELRRANPIWREALQRWEAEQSRAHGTWTAIVPTDEELHTGGQRYSQRKDLSIVAEGYAPTKINSTFTFKTKQAQPIVAFQLELLNDPTLPFGGPGRSIEGTCALTEFQVDVAPADHPEKKEKLKFVRAVADFNMPETPLKSIYDDRENANRRQKGEAVKDKRVLGPIAFAIDGKNETAWGVDEGPGRRNQPRKAYFYPEKPLSFPQGCVLSFALQQNHGGWNSNDNQSHNLGRFRISFTSTADFQPDLVPAPVAAILKLPAEKRTTAQQDQLFGHWISTVPAWKSTVDRIEALWRQHPEPTSQLVLVSMEENRVTSTLKRGDFLKPEKVVQPGVPSFMHQLPKDAAPTRLTFAKWLMDRRSPTVARSYVNRIWQAYFGTGIVPSSEELGSQSEPPSHPEMLDWLCVDFMNHGWSVKNLHRMIVHSATYQQTSRVTPVLLERDPYNRWLGRGPRFRVDAELVRDIALSASGLLDPRLGGPSAHPPAPEFLFLPPASYGTKSWQPADPSERYRRGLYTFRFRSVPYPALQSFDSPNGDFSCVRRSRSNTPMQALTTLNEPLFMECAQALAYHAVMQGGTTDETRLQFAFQRCTARRADAQEVKALLSLLDRQTERSKLDEDQAELLTGGRPQKFPGWPQDVSVARLAGWTTVARVLLNLDETITKE